MFGCITPTKTIQTKRSYEHDAKLLIARFARTVPTQSKTQPGFFDWLISQKPLWAPSTWRQHKAALIYYCQQHKISKLLELLETCNNSGCKQQPRRLPAAQRKTSAKKQKSISKADLERISRAYDANKAQPYWRMIGYMMFIAIYNTGLRPCELTRSRLWVRADDEGERRLYVQVPNAKNTNGRTHGKYRHVLIGQYKQSTQRMIDELLRLARSPQNANGKSITSERFVYYASQAFSAFTRKLFPRRRRSITLYSARHQFCADIKKSGMSRAQEGALVGHGNDLTASIHYGKRRSGTFRPDAPVPLNEEVARVKCVARPCPFAPAVAPASPAVSVPSAPLAQTQKPRGPTPGRS